MKRAACLLIALFDIGVSCGGPPDRIAGVMRTPPNLPTWINVPIRSILEEAFHTGRRVENDANAGAFAENRFGAGHGAQNMVLLTIGNGLGAGIIADGRLYHGATDLAGEIGHVRLTHTGPIGDNKAGSVESLVSGGVMAKVAMRTMGAARKRGQNTLLEACLAGGKALTARDVGMTAQKGDALAQCAIKSTGRRMGEAPATLVDILNPARIVIGGGDAPERRVTGARANRNATGGAWTSGGSLRDSARCTG